MHIFVYIYISSFSLSIYLSFSSVFPTFFLSASSLCQFFSFCTIFFRLEIFLYPLTISHPSWSRIGRNIGDIRVCIVGVRAVAASNPGQLIHKIIINNNNNQEQWNQKSRLSYYQWNNDDFHRTATVAPSSTAATATAVEPHAAALSYKPYQSVYSNHQRLSDNPNSGGTSVRESRYYNKLRYSMNFLFFLAKRTLNVSLFGCIV